MVDFPLFAELKRRRVFRALVGYGIAAFAVLQIVEPLMHGFRWPDAMMSYVVVALAAAFPVVVALAWIFDVREGRIEPSPGPPLRARLALALAGISLLAAAPGLLWYFVARRAPPAAAPSIAVLPFADMSPAKDQEYFSDGIAEEILNALAQVDGLRVAGRTSSFSFKGKTEDLPAIAEKLHVAHVLEGSVRKEANRIRITAQLISASDGYHVWSKTFERELPGVFAVQDEIARAVVDALKIRLVPGKQLAESQPTNAEAYRLLLLSRELWWNGQDVEAVLAVCEKVVVADPNYAPGWAALAMTLNSVNRPDETAAEREARHRRSLDSAERAVKFDPSLGIAYAARGLLRMELSWDWQGAKVDLERALELTPSDSRTNKFYGGYFATQGRLDDALRLHKRAIELDPLLHSNWQWLGWTYLERSQFSLARDAFQRKISLWHGSYDDPYSWIAMSYLLERQCEPADAWVQKVQGESARLELVGWLEHVCGHPERSKAAVGAFVAKYGGTDPVTAAQLYAIRGEPDRAFEWLERAYETHGEGLAYVKVDPSLKSLHGDPRWTAFLGKMKLPPD